MTNFHVGQKVVLVRDFDPGIREEARVDGMVLPEVGVVYTVRDVRLSAYGLDIRLGEVVNDLFFYLDLNDWDEQGFDATRFRPVVERKTDIGMSMLRSLLNTQPDEVLA